MIIKNFDSIKGFDSISTIESCYTTFNGTNQFITVDSLVSDTASDTTGTWSIWFRMPDVTPSLGNVLLSFGDTDTFTYLMIGISTNENLDVGTAGVVEIYYEIHKIKH